ncbi:Probable G-protein coupled receptor 158 [Eumeta japonica]|uniref:Probable G-protein coupled receptor 158 n=1 Tax=Eumeta variegata TaxID=151549 RepID=A0A4C1SVG2_EUMVA|nr:Probable G-protein coupled receptor 158 [Eumeta japonica]
MRARWSAACTLLWAACAAAAPAEPTPPLPLSTTRQASAASPSPLPPCKPLFMRTPPPLPAKVREHEAAVMHTARALSELIEQGVANEAHAAVLARAAARAPLSPPPVAVALGAPQLPLGVLYVSQPPRLVVFQRNNTADLEQFWKTLASAWNASSAVWAGAWLSCEGGAARGWLSGVAAASGLGRHRAAAALFRRVPAVRCEDALHPWLGGAPLCDPLTTDCEASLDLLAPDLVLQYRCRCRTGYWHAGTSDWIEFGRRGEGDDERDTWLACSACGVSSDAAACLLGDVYRAVLFAANLAGMLLCLIIALVIFKKRKCKAVAMGMWTVLEVVLLGALLMYASAASQYVTDARWRCLAGAWLRELGFVACYGSVVLRLWVVLAEFRTRKAHRWTPRDSEVLRVVGAMVSGAACYLAAFTATAACGKEGEGHEECARAAWHHVTAAAELLLLAAGARIAYAARNANVPFQILSITFIEAHFYSREPQYKTQWVFHAVARGSIVFFHCAPAYRTTHVAGPMLCVNGRYGVSRFALQSERGWLAAALCCEGACGVAWRAAAVLGAAPERSPLAATARAHLSSGAALACVLAPRLWHGYRARSLAQEVSRRGPAEGFGAEGEEEPTSEEVRAELKRLYVQLEILRNKTLRRDNPHISKRRGGRKPPHRRFSLQMQHMSMYDHKLQALQARRGGKGKAGGSASVVEASEAGDASRTPEDSVCSAEGPSHYTDGDTQA